MRSAIVRKLSRLRVGDVISFNQFVRSASESVHHTWPPSNQLTATILALARENLPRSDNVLHDNDTNSHKSSALHASKTADNCRPFPVIVDLTFGDGFHSRAILEEFKKEENLVLFAMDRDPGAVQLAEALKLEETRRVVPIHAK